MFREGHSSDVMVTSQDEGVQTLTRLGLTLCQARIYISLARSGMSTTKTISNASKVTQQDVYRIMPTLQELGLVEKAVAKPEMFRAVPIECALSTLLQHRIEETSELQEETKELLKKFKNNNTVKIASQEEPQFILIPEKDALTLRGKQSIIAARKSIDIAITWKRFQGMLLVQAKELRKAIRRGVRIRFITEKTVSENLWPEIVQAFTRNPSFKLRFIPHPLDTVFSVYDEKEAFISTSTAGDAAQYPALWSNNSSLASAMHDLFELMWHASPMDQKRMSLVEATPS